MPLSLWSLDKHPQNLVREFSPQISDRQMWRIEERRTVIFAICMHFKLLQHHTRHARSLGPITIYSSLGILPKHSSHRMYGIARVRACVFAGGASTGVRESFSEPAALMLADIAVVFIMTSTLTLYDVRRIGIHWVRDSFALSPVIDVSPLSHVATLRE